MINICGGPGGFVHNFVATWLQDVAMLAHRWPLDGMMTIDIDSNNMMA